MYIDKLLCTVKKNYVTLIDYDRNIIAVSTAKIFHIPKLQNNITSKVQGNWNDYLKKQILARLAHQNFNFKEFYFNYLNSTINKTL